MTLGPLEYIVIGFDRPDFTGAIATEIEKVVEKRIIRLVDVVVAQKDGEGNVEIVEIDNVRDPKFASFAPLLEDRMGLLTPEDIITLGEGLPNDSAALILLFEHRWAEKIKDAIIEAGGFLVAARPSRPSFWPPSTPSSRPRPPRPAARSTIREHDPKGAPHMMMRRRGMGLIGVAATTAVVAGTAGAVSHHQQQKYANQQARRSSSSRRPTRPASRRRSSRRWPSSRPRPLRRRRPGGAPDRHGPAQAARRPARGRRPHGRGVRRGQGQAPRGRLSSPRHDRRPCGAAGPAGPRPHPGREHGGSRRHRIQGRGHGAAGVRRRRPAAARPRHAGLRRCRRHEGRAGKTQMVTKTGATSSGALMGGFWGMLIGLLFIIPVAGPHHRRPHGCRDGDDGRLGREERVPPASPGRPQAGPARLSCCSSRSGPRTRRSRRSPRSAARCSRRRSRTRRPRRSTRRSPTTRAPRRPVPSRGGGRPAGLTPDPLAAVRRSPGSDRPA